MPDEFNAAATQSGERPASTALSVEVCEELPVAAADLVEIYRYLGYPRDRAPAPQMAERIGRVVAEARLSLRPRGAYAVYSVTSRTARSLALGGVAISGHIGEFLEDAERVAVFVVTVGAEISHLAEAAAKNGDAFSAWVMDATGSWAAEGAAEALMGRVRRHLRDGEELTLRYSPGYCGMDIGQQRVLFQLVEAEAVGVTLMPSMLMYPLKSISGLVGLAPREAVSRYRSPCEVCGRDGCHMRR